MKKIIFIFLFLLLILGFLVLKSRSSGKKESGTMLTSAPGQSPIEEIKYLKRQFDPAEKFYHLTDYPQEIININENQLIGMRCSPRLECFSPYTECSLYSGGGSSPKYPVGEQILKLIKEANETKDKETEWGPIRDIANFSFCETDDGRKILWYKTGGGGGGAGSVDYIGLTNPDKVERIAAIIGEYAYFACDKPLQLTKSNILYYQCGSLYGSTIYKIDLSSKIFSPLISCVINMSEEANLEPVVCN